jgi:hypothetical protein
MRVPTTGMRVSANDRYASANDRHEKPRLRAGFGEFFFLELARIYADVVMVPGEDSNLLCNSLISNVFTKLDFRFTRPVTLSQRRTRGCENLFPHSDLATMLDSAALDVVYVSRSPWEWGWDAWVAIGTLTLAAVTSVTVVSIWLDLSRRKKAAFAHWAILGREIEYFVAKAQWCLRGMVGPGAPLYRLNHPAYEKSLPALVSDAEPSADDFEALLAFYAWVQDVNRGLDRAASQPVENTDMTEVTRVRSKCEELISEFYPPARAAVERHAVRLRDAASIEAAYKRPHI